MERTNRLGDDDADVIEPARQQRPLCGKHKRIRPTGIHIRAVVCNILANNRGGGSMYIHLDMLGSSLLSSYLEQVNDQHPLQRELGESSSTCITRPSMSHIAPKTICHSSDNRHGNLPAHIGNTAVPHTHHSIISLKARQHDNVKQVDDRKILQIVSSHITVM